MQLALPVALRPSRLDWCDKQLTWYLPHEVAWVLRGRLFHNNCYMRIRPTATAPTDTSTQWVRIIPGRCCRPAHADLHRRVRAATPSNQPRRTGQTYLMICFAYINYAIFSFNYYCFSLHCFMCRKSILTALRSHFGITSRPAWDFGIRRS